LKEVAHRGAAAEELPIAGPVELAIRPPEPTTGPGDPTGGPGGDGAFLDDELVAVQEGRDRAGDLLHLAEVRPPVASGRRSDADEDDVRARDRVLGPCRELEPPGFDVVGQQLGEAGLVYGRRPLGEGRD